MRTADQPIRINLFADDANLLATWATKIGDALDTDNGEITIPFRPHEIVTVIVS